MKIRICLYQITELVTQSTILIHYRQEVLHNWWAFREQSHISAAVHRVCVCLQTNSHWWLPGSSSTCSSDAECAPKRGDAGFPWWHRDLPDSDVSARNISNGSRRARACVCGPDGMEDTLDGFGRRNFMRLMFPEQTLSRKYRPLHSTSPPELRDGRTEGRIRRVRDKNTDGFTERAEGRFREPRGDGECLQASPTSPSFLPSSPPPLSLPPFQ